MVAELQIAITVLEPLGTDEVASAVPMQQSPRPAAQGFASVSSTGVWRAAKTAKKVAPAGADAARPRGGRSWAANSMAAEEPGQRSERDWIH